MSCFVLRSKTRISKLTYYLSVDKKELHPDQVPVLDVSKIHGTILPESELYSYRSLFYIDFTQPVLKTDIIRIDKPIKELWAVFRSGMNYFLYR